MAEQKSMRIEESLSLLATSSARSANALERLVALNEAQHNDAAAVRQQIEEAFIRLHSELKAAMPKLEEVAALVEQTADEKSDESEDEEEDEGQLPAPVAAEAPAETKPAESKQEKKEEPAASVEAQPAKPAEKPAEAPAPKAEQAEPMDPDSFRDEFLKLTRRFGAPRVRTASSAVMKKFNLERLSACAPAERIPVLKALKAELGAGA